MPVDAADAALPSSQILCDIILNGRWGEAAQSVEMGQALKLKVRTIRLTSKYEE